jgi:6-phosphogluconolactonase/glucosamine-6-phosphate isomerase/deaminase
MFLGSRHTLGYRILRTALHIVITVTGSHKQTATQQGSHQSHQILLHNYIY